MSADKHDKRDLLVLPVALAVLIGWFVTLVQGVLTGSFVGLTITTPLMLALAGYVFGVSVVRRKDSDE